MKNDIKKAEPLVSVIIPVYNGEKYIQNVTNTVMGQTYGNIELIMINDGSKDDSAAILQQIQSDNAEKGIKIIQQENQGICRTRNCGLDLATGEYVMFMDQDDTMKSDCVEQLVNVMEQENADMAIGGFDLIDSEGRKLENWKLDPKYIWSKFRINAPWGRLFKRQIVETHNIRFMETKISEDFYFNYLYMSYCNKIAVTEYVGYGWLYNEKSESHSNMSQFAEDRNPLVMMTRLQKNMKVPNILENEYVEYAMVKHIIWYLFYVAKSMQTKDLLKMHQNCIQWLETYYPGYKRNKLFSICVHFNEPMGEAFKTRMIVKVGVLLERLGILKNILKVYSKLK